jgi:hypothetical protein
MGCNTAHKQAQGKLFTVELFALVTYLKGSKSLKGMQSMTNLKNLLFVAAFLAIGFSVQAEEAKHEAGHEQSSEKHGKPDFFPKKQADPNKAPHLGMAELLEPKALSPVSGTTVTLKWKAVVGADSYRVQVATDPNFKWLVSQQDFHKETSLQVNDLKSGQHYYWRVYAWKQDADPSWMSGFASASSFEVK